MTEPTVAYFSMEIGVDAAIPTYAGGLGILAGDTVRSAADLGLPFVAITLLSRKGYFRQRIDTEGRQLEEPASWPVERHLAETAARVTVEIEGRAVLLRAWRYEVGGVNGHTVPVFFLDTDVPGNSRFDRGLTDFLYGGDARYRLCQEAILGIGGVRMLRALGYTDIIRYHMNEGHASLLVLELLSEHAKRLGEPMVTMEHVEAIRPLCVFTTHTPVPAGHDKFPLDLVHRVLGPAGVFAEREREFCWDGVLNLTYLALHNSHYINGVAKRHREISRQMYAEYAIDSITNGVHVATWACEPMRRLFDEFIPGWREDNASLRYAISIPKSAIWSAHQQTKGALLEHARRVTGQRLDAEVFTIGFARRFTEYKRPDTLFCDIERLEAVAREHGAIQIIYAGKAHPQDRRGKELIQQIHRIAERLRGRIPLVYLPDYDMHQARLMTGGCDLWLNTPLAPLEASGTSGMKAAINAVPSLSILDGWWIEGCIEGVTGWSLDGGRSAGEEERQRRDGAAIYQRLQEVVLPLFYQTREEFLEVMRNAIALNGSFFNTERMLSQYVTRAYFL